MKKLTLNHIKFVAFEMAREMMSWDEPIPEFDTRYPGALESCLAVPFQTFGQKMLYAGLIEKAAILFCLLIKNHPFENGNKRVAMTGLLVFLYLNKKWIKVDNQEMYNFAVWVASSPAEFKDQVVDATRAFIERNIISLRKS